MLAVVACSDGPGARCGDIVDDAVDVFQELISAVDDLDLAEAAAAGEDFAMPGIDDMERRADVLQSEAEAAGCDDQDLRQLLTERISRLEARTVFGQAVIEGIRQEGLFDE
jgi:predicted membrane GTPase involved in stress response